MTLVELPSSIGGDVYTNALASGAIDAAPIRNDLVAQRYVRDYGGKAAALRIFIQYWGRGQAWINTHTEALARGYYAGTRGLPLADARVLANYYRQRRRSRKMGWRHRL